MYIEGVCGQQRLIDGQQARVALGFGAELLFSEIGGKYAYQTMRNNGYVFSTTSAASITALGNNLPTIFNPLGSGVATVVDKVTFQAAAIGTPVIGGTQYGFLANAGAQISTAGPILTATFVAGVSLNINSKRVPQTLFAPAAITFTTAPALLAPVGLNFGATATQIPWSGVDDVDGRIVLTPGCALQIGCSTASSTTFNVAFWCYEIPLPMSI